MTIKKSKRIETKEVEDITYICDRCGKDATPKMYHAALQKCAICGKEVCHACRMSTDSLLHDYVSGDYPHHRVCHVCWEAGEPYRKRMLDVEAHAEEEIDAIEEEWRVYCG